MDTLSYIDIGILILLILLSIKGIWQGIIRGLTRLLGILLGIFFASRFYKDTGSWFAHNIYDISTQINSLIGFLIILVVIWVVFVLLGEYLFRMIKFTPLAVLDGILGLAFGFLKAFLLISIIIFGISQIAWLNHFSQSIERNSSLFPIMKNVAIYIMNLEEIKEAKENIDIPLMQKEIESINENPQEENKEELDTNRDIEASEAPQ